VSSIQHPLLFGNLKRWGLQCRGVPGDGELKAAVLLRRTHTLMVGGVKAHEVSSLSHTPSLTLHNVCLIHSVVDSLIRTLMTA
jgi:hypothetical protein